MDKHVSVSACHDMERLSDLYSEVRRGLSKSSSLFEGQLLRDKKKRVLYGRISEALYILNLWVQLGPARVLLNPFPIPHCRVLINKGQKKKF